MSQLFTQAAITFQPTDLRIHEQAGEQWLAAPLVASSWQDGCGIPGTNQEQAPDCTCQAQGEQSMPDEQDVKQNEADEQEQDVRELPEETLPNDNGLLVALRRTVIDWTQAMSIQSMEWMAHDNMSQNFKVMTAATPRLKTQSHGKVGVAHVAGLDGG